MFDFTLIEHFAPLFTAQIIILLAVITVLLIYRNRMQAATVYLVLYSTSLLIGLWVFQGQAGSQNITIASLGLFLSILLFHSIQKIFGRIQPVYILLDVSVIGISVFGATTQQVMFASLMYTVFAINLLRLALTKADQYHHRNRMYYWLPVVIGQVVVDLLFIDNPTAIFFFPRIGILIYILSISIAKNLPDIKFILQKTLQKSILIAFVFSYIISVGIGLAFLNETAQRTLFFAAAIILLTFTFQFFSERLDRVTKTVFRMVKMDTQGLISDFDHRLRKTSNLSSVVETIDQFIIEKLGADHSKLILVDPLKETTGEDGFFLQEYRTFATENEAASLYLVKIDQLVNVFSVQQDPVLAYDLDFSSDFENVAPSVKHWFASLGAELFIPVFEKQNWIGLLAIGLRKKNRYDPIEIAFLKSVAIQAGATLENARLIEKLTVTNDELKQSIATLENISRDLSNLETIKSNFISIASHELRTPLTVTRGYVEMLMDDETLPATQKDLLKGIYKGVLKQEEILDSLFELAKLDSSSEQLRSEEISMNDLVKEVAQKMMKVINQRQQVLMIDLPDLPKMMGDKGSIRRLFLNILQNAVKFTPDHGKITITGFAVKESTSDEAGVEMIVRDTGVGISKDLQEVIFTRFYQPGEKVDTLSSSKFKFKGSGLGLGLALSRAIVKAHGGRIWVDSTGYDERGCPGSEFHFFFPFKPQNIFPEIKKDH